jgi:hypothetical protein
MLRYLLRRIAWMVPTFLGITLLVFAAARATPGNAASVAAFRTDGMDSAGDAGGASANYRAESLLDQPLWKQYLQSRALRSPPAGIRASAGAASTLARPRLDFGREYGRPSVPVGDEILRRLR